MSLIISFNFIKMKSRYDDGAKKRRKKKREEELTRSLANSMFRYFKKPKSFRTDEEAGIDKVVRIDQDDEHCETSKKGEVDGIRIESEEQEANDYRVDKDGVDTLDPANWGKIDRMLRDFLVERSSSTTV